MPASSHAAEALALANYLGRGETDARLRRVDESLALAALVGFASRLKARRLTRIEIERFSWRDDSAHVELCDGAVLVVEVRVLDPQYPPTVELEHLHRLGEVVNTGALAEQWLDANEAEVLDSWCERCRRER